MAGTGEAGLHSWSAGGLNVQRVRGRHEWFASLLIGAPLGLGILLALGILTVVMTYLAQ
jgi:hypothetical protein